MDNNFNGKGFITNNFIDFESKHGVRFIIPIHNKVTIITGDSATGKTKMLNHLEMLLIDKEEIVKCNPRPEQIIICNNRKDVDNYIRDYNDKKVTNKIVIIDRFDTMSDDEDIINFIAESQNVFIVCAHSPFEQCGYSTRSMLGLRCTGKTYEAYQLFKRPSDAVLQTDVLI